MDIQVAKQDFMKKFAQVILKMDDLDKFLSSLTQMVAEAFEVVWATLSLRDEDLGKYILKASSQRMQDVEENIEAARIDDADSWLKERQRILSRRLLDEIGSQMAPELKNELNKPDTFVSMPLFAGEQLIGVLNLGAKADNEDFSKEELELLSELAQLFAPIVERALHHHRIKEQRLHYQNILDNLVSGIVAIDPEDKITVFNRTAERILKYRAEQQVLGKDARILQANLANLLLDTLHKGKSYRREELLILPENTLIGVSTSQFYDARGKLLGACMVFSALSEIKRRERATRQQDLDNYWSNVANSLAQEVKNSIVATKVYAEMFPKKYEDAEFRWNLYSTLRRDMGKLDNFTEKVLNFAQTQQLSMQSCEIDKVVDAAINSALQDRDIGEIAFEKRYSQNLASLKGDYHQLKGAFAQIINNALEAMGKKGTLSISIEEESSPQMLTYNLSEAVVKELPVGSIVVVKITDSGCGISAQDMPHLFDPFFTTKEARTGLGLASARKVIQRHQGAIRAESKSSEGSTFWIVLPISSE